jgi:hypothetical protein
MFTVVLTFWRVFRAWAFTRTAERWRTRRDGASDRLGDCAKLDFGGEQLISARVTRFRHPPDPTNSLIDETEFQHPRDG